MDVLIAARISAFPRISCLGELAEMLCVEENVVPWNQSYFPQSMRNLPPQVREKAIEIANALLAQ